MGPGNTEADQGSSQINLGDFFIGTGCVLSKWFRSTCMRACISRQVLNTYRGVCITIRA